MYKYKYMPCSHVIIHTHIHIYVYKYLNIIKGVEDFFTSQNIKDCMKKVIVVGLHETIKVDDELELKAYYAGHVIGAG